MGAGRSDGCPQRTLATAGGDSAGTTEHEKKNGRHREEEGVPRRTLNSYAAGSQELQRVGMEKTQDTPLTCNSGFSDGRNP